jgi:hypothetical protein
MVQLALVLASAFLLSRMPIGTYQRPAVFVVVYAAGTAYFVVRRFWKKEVSMA